ncbi:MAG: hypothetical protein ABGX08_02680 [Citromicrobium sp.]
MSAPENPQGGWQPIETEPEIGTVAILYFPQEVSDDFDGIDYRFQIAIYKRTPLGDNWHEQGTNHLSFDGPDMKGDWTASHYLPLSEPTESAPA